MNQATGGSLSRAEQPTASTSAVTVEAAAAAAAQEAQITSTTGTTARSARNVNLPRPTISTTVLEHGMKGVPDRFELCEMDALIDLLAHMLDKMIAHNDQVPLLEAHLTRFHSRAPPGISVVDYIRRIVQWTPVEPAALLITLLYIETFSQRRPGFSISSLTVHRFLITSIMLAAKALSDSFMTNARYAKVGGIQLGEINVLEREMLQALDYCCHSPGALLAAFYHNLVEGHPGYTILKTDVKDRFSRATAPDTATEWTTNAASNNGSVAPVDMEVEPTPPASAASTLEQNGTIMLDHRRKENDVSALKRKLSSADLAPACSSPSPALSAAKTLPAPETVPNKKPKTPLLTAADGSPQSRSLRKCTHGATTSSRADVAS